MKNNASFPQNEFSRRINICQYAEERETFHISATSEECHQLAQRFGLNALNYFEATLSFLKSSNPNLYPLKAQLSASVEYFCIKTLEPFEENISEIVYFTAESSLSETPQESVVLTQEDDIIEPLDSEGFLDVGEVVSQYLSLALNSYPVAPFQSTGFISRDKETEDFENKESNAHSPFKKLSLLKSKISNPLS